MGGNLKKNKRESTKRNNNKRNSKYSKNLLEMNKDKEIELKDYNYLPYTQALRIDKRENCTVLFDILKQNITFITILCYADSFQSKSLSLSLYALDFQFDFFMNAMLYSDEVVSEKYHNNGELDMFTSLFLSLSTNIISTIIFYFIGLLIRHHLIFSLIEKEVTNSKMFLYHYKKVNKFMLIQSWIFYLIAFTTCIGMTYYLGIFCVLYKQSQTSLLKNYFIGVAESVAITVGVTLIGFILRVIGLKYHKIQIYRSSRAGTDTIYA